MKQLKQCSNCESFNGIFSTTGNCSITGKAIKSTDICNEYVWKVDGYSPQLQDITDNRGDYKAVIGKYNSMAEKGKIVECQSYSDMIEGYGKPPEGLVYGSWDYLGVGLIEVQGEDCMVEREDLLEEKHLWRYNGDDPVVDDWNGDENE